MECASFFTLSEAVDQSPLQLLSFSIMADKGQVDSEAVGPFSHGLSVGNFEDVKYRSGTISALAANVTFTFVSVIDLGVCCSL